MKKSLISVLVLVLAVTVLGPPAMGRERAYEGSFVAEAMPLPVAWAVSGETCMEGVEGVHRVTHPLRAPFSGWLEVKADFGGDWDLAVYGEDGRLALSGEQDATGGSVETLRLFVTRGREMQIVVCNFASQTQADVAYRLLPGTPWLKPAGLKFSSHTEVLDYAMPAAATRSHYVFCYSGMTLSCSATANVHATDRFVQVQIQESASDLQQGADLGISAEVYQYSGSTYLGKERFCTSTDRPIRLEPGVSLVGIVIYLGDCENGSPAMGLRGRARLIFTNRPPAGA